MGNRRHGGKRSRGGVHERQKDHQRHRADESIVDPTDVEMLEDLIMAAINDGYAKADKVYEEKMGKYGDMGSLGGMI